jgi:NADPH2:quinone reductase
MRAIIYDRYGAPDVLRFADRPQPRRTAEQVLIRVGAASINPIDWRIRRGEARYLIPFGFPRVPGYDVAGEIDEAPSSSGFARGDRVIAFLDNWRGGAYAEYAACSPRVVTKIPDELSIEDAAALPLAGTTALQCLRDHGHLQAGQHVVITGATGGVGSYAVQLAAAMGARVTGIGSEPHRELAQSLGAHAFVDYRQSGYLKQVEPCDLFLDAAGKTSLRGMRSCLKRHGRMVSTEPSPKLIGLSLVTWALPLLRVRTMWAEPNADDLATLVNYWQAGKLRVLRNDTFPLEQAAAAHEHGEAHRGTGKIVLQVAALN